MLSRRAMRVKVFHTLYAYRQLTAGTFHHAIDKIRLRFEPPILEELSSAQRAQRQQDKVSAFATFEEQTGGRHVLYSLPPGLRNSQLTTSSVTPPEEQEVVADVADYFAALTQIYWKQHGFFEEEVAKIKALYSALCQVFSQCVSWERSLKLSTAGHEGLGLGGNPFLAILCAQPMTAGGVFATSEWRNIVRRWWQRIYGENFYCTYLQSSSPSLHVHSKVLSRMLSSFISNTEVTQYVVVHDICAFENKEIVRIFFLQALKNFQKKADTRYVFKMDDATFVGGLQFMRSLYEAVLRHAERARLLLRESISHWEVDRVAHTDLVLLSMAIAEFCSFRSVPVLSVMNEYIDIAKVYGTPKSHQFLNGILASVLSQLEAQNERQHAE